ncbi:hypothetical protein ACFL02_05385 [Planctomycetota bacterium]
MKQRIFHFLWLLLLLHSQHGGMVVCYSVPPFFYLLVQVSSSLSCIYYKQKQRKFPLVFNDITLPVWAKKNRPASRRIVTICRQELYGKNSTKRLKLNIAHKIYMSRKKEIKLANLSKCYIISDIQYSGTTDSVNYLSHLTAKSQGATNGGLLSQRLFYPYIARGFYIYILWIQCDIGGSSALDVNVSLLFVNSNSLEA